MTLLISSYHLNKPLAAQRITSPKPWFQGSTLSLPHFLSGPFYVTSLPVWTNFCPKVACLTSFPLFFVWCVPEVCYLYFLHKLGFLRSLGTTSVVELSPAFEHSSLWYCNYMDGLHPPSCCSHVFSGCICVSSDMELL